MAYTGQQVDPANASSRAASGACSLNHPKSVGAAFHRSYNDIDLDDLCFHDLRHEGTSRLFEAGFSIKQVAMVTEHKDWRMLRRYTNLKPEDLYKMQKAAQPSREQLVATLVAG